MYIFPSIFYRTTPLIHPREKNPSIIAFSTTTYTLDRCAEIAKKVRKNFPNKLTLIGGSHANVASMETANTYDYFDIISYGLDGEYIIYDLVKKYSSKKFNRNDFLNDEELMKSIKGIIFKVEKKIVRNAPSETIKDLDELPFPARDLFPLERYKPLENQYRKLPATTMVVIRGCPYVCTFCDQARTGARRRSPKKVVEEMKYCVEKLGVKEITFWDDTLSYHKKWMREFLNLLIKENLNLSWSCYAAVNTVDREILQLMGKAGDCYLFSHSLWHGPAPNQTNHGRKTILYNYSQLFMRWYDYGAVVPDEILDKCTPRQRRLLGDLGYEFRPGSYFYVPEDQEAIIRQDGSLENALHPPHLDP